MFGCKLIGKGGINWRDGGVDLDNRMVCILSFFKIFLKENNLFYYFIIFYVVVYCVLNVYRNLLCFNMEFFVWNIDFFLVFLLNVKEFFKFLLFLYFGVIGLEMWFIGYFFFCFNLDWFIFGFVIILWKRKIKV